ncbi:hypothetical protein I4U23_011528 [Adineta vaga]|nr:hypothetical protein I4U23_011528 [Adineta vaga]
MVTTTNILEALLSLVDHYLVQQFRSYDTLSERKECKLSCDLIPANVDEREQLAKIKSFVDYLAVDLIHHLKIFIT